ncbi:hypothetical protein [Clostridium chauvoei]|uniref:Uncharacterized protein n=2 Tax=Clostridium chauvoei TaxID=46867 RepID=A0A1U6J0F7_9CLOT|nr:hypothetical protein [Clostridium chauvoei]ATD54334.1 hypothetical protein BTM20_03420 [Clostridium chauvoei]ATD57982.1 hypothetical protein BTM21_09640 [Clostridium chauvoei]MBX7279778.1 hypothetical protein [Clostridium chauvoei]MBX7282147.1 hypothetical protein [Clostridium chauvoei]MBX7284669.1 hypothetical protein [Clostridium chauvoei]
MKNKCRELLKSNNKREKEIYKNNEKIYTDMIVYLRGSDMTEYNQELVREDLIQMIIDGQNRGDDIQKVIGENYKEVCDEIIETMPKKTTFEKVIGIVEMSTSSIWILGMVYIIRLAIGNFITHNESWNFSLSIGDIINILIVISLANIFVNYICKTSLNNKKENKVVSFLKTWVVCMLILGIMVICAYYLNYTIVNISIISAVIIVAVIFIIDRVLARYVA